MFGIENSCFISSNAWHRKRTDFIETVDNGNGPIQIRIEAP